MEIKRALIGRERETSLLKEYINTDKSEFIVVYGRRRVGKTFLIRKVIGDQACFTLTGMENSGMHDQLLNFHFTLRKSRMHWVLQVCKAGHAALPLPPPRTIRERKSTLS